MKRRLTQVFHFLHQKPQNIILHLHMVARVSNSITVHQDNAIPEDILKSCEVSENGGEDAGAEVCFWFVATSQQLPIRQSHPTNYIHQTLLNCNESYPHSLSNCRSLNSSNSCNNSTWLGWITTSKQNQNPNNYINNISPSSRGITRNSWTCANAQSMTFCVSSAMTRHKDAPSFLGSNAFTKSPDVLMCMHTLPHTTVCGRPITTTPWHPFTSTSAFSCNALYYNNVYTLVPLSMTWCFAVSLALSQLSSI